MRSWGYNSCIHINDPSLPPSLVACANAAPYVRAENEHANYRQYDSEPNREVKLWRVVLAPVIPLAVADRLPGRPLRYRHGARYGG